MYDGTKSAMYSPIFYIYQNMRQRNSLWYIALLILGGTKIQTYKHTYNLKNCQKLIYLSGNRNLRWLVHLTLSSDLLLFNSLLKQIMFHLNEMAWKGGGIFLPYCTDTNICLMWYPDCDLNLRECDWCLLLYNTSIQSWYLKGSPTVISNSRI